MTGTTTPTPEGIGTEPGPAPTSDETSDHHPTSTELVRSTQPTAKRRRRLLPDSYTDRWWLAEKYCRSNIAPAHLRTPEAMMLAFEAADAFGVPVFSVFLGMHLIDGRVTFGANFIRGRVNDAGHRFRVMERTPERARVRIIRHDDPEPFYAEFTLQDAIDAELVVVDPKTGLPKKKVWQNYMKAMLVARATTLAVRECCPEVMFGDAYTPDELGGDVLDEEDRVVRLPAERVVAKTTEVTDKAEAARARWRADIEGAADAEAVNRLYAAAQAQKFGDGTTLLDRRLYDDGTTVEAALAARVAELLKAEQDDPDAVHDAEILEDHDPVPDPESAAPPVPGEPSEPAPVPDPPDLCRMTAARRGILAALSDGGNVAALVDVEYGLPVEQVSTRRLRELVTRAGAQ